MDQASATDFMTLSFRNGAPGALRGEVAAMACGPYGYVVTPNVDHVVRLLGGRVDEAVYRGAALMVCDSRILSGLARLKGKRLSVYPGSDLTADLLAAPQGLRFGLFGPDEAAATDLIARFPDVAFTFIPAPMMAPGSAQWDRAVAQAAAADWDVLLVCISFPKQEQFAHALKAAGRVTGVALCVGASVDFLTGRQSRAPKLFQTLGIEWLYRLASQPRRMFRRYVIEGPAIFGWFLRLEAFGGRV